jgi:hypothetical protein
MFTDGAVREIARIALVHGTGARGLRAVVEKIVEGVLFDSEPGVKYVITEDAVRGGEAVRRSLTQPRAPLSAHFESRTRPDFGCAEWQSSRSDSGSVLDFADLLCIVK